MKVFISGSIGIKSLSETALAYLEDVIKGNHVVLIGDAHGVDKAVQQYLAREDYQNVTVYFSGERVRNNIGNWQIKQIPNPEGLKGRSLYQLKDKAMARDCDRGFMVWEGKSKGTKDNMDYLTELGKHYLVIRENTSQANK
jgi:hypothetical protein